METNETETVDVPASSGEQKRAAASEAKGKGEIAAPPDNAQPAGSTEPGASPGLHVPDGLVTEPADHDQALVMVAELDGLGLSVPTGELQVMVEAIAEEMQSAEHRGLDLSDMNECESAIRNRWRNDFAANHAVVYKTCQALGPKFCDYLDRTGLGNSPVVLDAILRYASGDTKLTAVQAQEELGKLMADPLYRRRGENTRLVSRSRLLSRLAHGSDGANGAKRTGRTTAPAPVVKAAADSPATLDEQIEALHKSTMAEKDRGKREALLAQLSGLYQQKFPE